MKGLGYALEAMVALLTLILFSLGALQIADFEQDWGEYQREVAAQDLTYSLETSGHTSNFISRGETGSIQTAMTTISDRSMEVSGLVSEIPVTELSIGFYTLGDDTEEVDVTTLNSCDADEISELQDFSSDDILETDGGLEDEDEYNVTLFFGNTNAAGSTPRAGYDTLWVDNGTNCQFAAEDGPFYLDEIFYWGDDDTPEDSNYYDFKSIDADESSGGTADFYRATQAVNIIEAGSPGPNDIRTNIRPDMVDRDGLDSESFDITVFTEMEALGFMNDNEDLMIDLINEGSMMVLANPGSETDITDNDFLSRTGISWMGTGFSDSYSGDEADAAFSDEPHSIEVDTFYTGMEGNSNFEMTPPGQAVSNKSDDLSPSRTIYSLSETYDTVQWQSNDMSMNSIDESSTSLYVPDDYCTNYNYDEESPGEEDLTEGTVNFPNEGDVDILSVKLGQSDDFCDDQIERGIVFEFEDDLYLNGERVEIGGIEYIIDSNVDVNNEDECDFWGECANFIPSITNSDDNVELMITRERMQDIEGAERFAMSGYQETYTDDQRTALMSTIFWLAGDERSFEGEDDPENVDSLSIGNIEGPAYMPYSLYMRWSD